MFLQDVNYDYTGGCLASLERGDNQLLLHPTGADWDQVCILLKIKFSVHVAVMTG